MFRQHLPSDGLKKYPIYCFFLRCDNRSQLYGIVAPPPRNKPCGRHSRGLAQYDATRKSVNVNNSDLEHVRALNGTFVPNANFRSTKGYPKTRAVSECRYVYWPELCDMRLSIMTRSVAMTGAFKVGHTDFKAKTRI